MLAAWPVDLQAREVLAWVPPYNFSNTRAILQGNFGDYSPSNGLNRIALQFWIPTATGGVIKTPYHEIFDSDVAWYRNWGTSNDCEVLLCVFNNVGPTGDGIWDWELARSAFSSNRTVFVRNLVATMNAHNLDGIDIDLEGTNHLTAGDRPAFKLFLEELSAELLPRGKVLTVGSFHSPLYNAPNMSWWADWTNLVDNIHSLGYADLYEGSTQELWSIDGYLFRYSWQQNYGVTNAGLAPEVVSMGLPGWTATWGSGGRGSNVLDHINECMYDCPVPAGICIWDIQLDGTNGTPDWHSSEVWEALTRLSKYESIPVDRDGNNIAIRNLQVSRPVNAAARYFSACRFDLYNHGPEPNVGTVRVEFYLSRDRTFGNADDRKIGQSEFANVNIPVGHTRTFDYDAWLRQVSRLWTAGLVGSGNYYVYAKATCLDVRDPNQGNNQTRTRSFFTYYAGSARVDLRIPYLRVSRSADTASRSFSACRLNLENRGPSMSSGKVLLEFYLSRNRTFGDGDDRKIGDTRPTGISIRTGQRIPLVLGPTRRANATRFWKAGLVEDGRYYVFARATALTARELRPNDNLGRTASRFRYTRPLVDLSIRNLRAVRPGNMALRRFNACKFHIVNRGEAIQSITAGVHFYLSRDRTFGNADDLKIGDTKFVGLSIPARSVKTITMGSTRRRSMVRLWTADLVPRGYYYLFARISPITARETKWADNRTRTTSRFPYSNLARSLVARSGKTEGAETLKSWPSVWARSGAGGWTAAPELVDDDDETIWTGEPDAGPWAVAFDFGETIPLQSLDLRFADDPGWAGGLLATEDLVRWFDLQSVTNWPAACRALFFDFHDDGSGRPPAIREIEWEE